MALKRAPLFFSEFFCKVNLRHLKGEEQEVPIDGVKDHEVRGWLLETDFIILIQNFGTRIKGNIFDSFILH